MPATQSLDELLSEKAVEFSDQIRAAASFADKEEDVKIASERLLAFIEKEAGIKLEGRHEFTVASGRIDSVYDRVIIEYKNPNSPDHIGPGMDAAGTRKLVEQIRKRFYDLRTQQHQPPNTLFGVGLDGKHFVFLRYRDDKWQEPALVEVNRYSAERFLWALFNLGTKGKPFAPEYLAADFGADREGTIAKDGVRTLYEAICGTDNPKAQTFFDQWKILFGEVCGYDVESPSEKIKKLAKSYGVPEKGLKSAELLFALQTYYALFMKLLANEVVTFFHFRQTTSPLEALIRATTSAQLRRELEKVESGGIFQHFNITNFLEGDLFAWYLPVWSEPIEKLIRAMVGRLDQYNPGTLSEDPAVSRDLLKKLYHQLFPKSVRHDLGEYYTPDWLAELVLDELGYEGDADKRLLDPACGSGTFLVMAINRIRHWYDKNRELRTYDEGELCRKILNNVVGFDLNPLAVLAARTNYLIAIRGLLGRVANVELPVYLCDSILTPSAYGERDQKQMYGEPLRLQTGAKPTPFFIPREVTTDRGVLARYTNLLADLAPVNSGYTSDEFLQRLEDDAIPCRERDDHLKLFEELRELDKANKNGVWARIIKNAFAPLFVQRVDYVAGNPPWVNWESLPDNYRDTLKPLWQDYGLFTLSGSAGRLGGGKKDLSMLFVYAAVDDYLDEGGRLGFVITQTVFKTKGAGDGFRQLQYQRGKKTVVIKPVVVHDLSDMQVFEGATNRTAVFVCEKQKRKFTYPVPYVQWRGPSRIGQDEALPDVREATRRQILGASPVEPDTPTSPWLTAPKEILSGIRKCFGQSDYSAFAGSCTWLNGVYWIRILQELPSGHLLIENLHDIGKIKVEKVQAAVEPDLIHPLLRGRDVARWDARPSVHVIVPQDPESRRGIPAPEMKRSYPKTYAYLKQFETELRMRSGFRRYFRDDDPFYSIYNVGTYTFARWKTVWRDMGNQIQVAVATNLLDRITCPEHHVMAVAVDSENEAHFLCAMLMSAPVQMVVSGYTTSTGISTHVLDHIAVPRFDRSNDVHANLASLSKQLHKMVSTDDEAETGHLQAEVDRLSAQLWGVTKKELTAIRSAIADAREDARPPRKRKGKSATETRT